MAYTAAQYKADLAAAQAKAQNDKPVIPSASPWPAIWCVVAGFIGIAIVAPMITPVSIPTAIMLSAVLLYYKK